MMSVGRVAWLEGLDVAPQLPERTVVVRDEAVAHAWRRDVLLANRPDLLRGTRFVTSLGVATAVLEAAGRRFSLGEETVRPARVAATLATPLRLAEMDLEVLRHRPGWEKAIAATLGDLEAAGFDPVTLQAVEAPFTHDLAMIWSRVEGSAGNSWTAARVLREATRLLDEDRDRWPFDGPVLSEITGHETVVQARWLRAIPDATLVALAVSPASVEHAARRRSLFDVVRLTPPASSRRTERDLLVELLFASPASLTAADRPRSAGIDGSVQVEEHPGVEEEIDAAVAWAVSRVGEGEALEDLAIVVPHLDPYASLLADRFDALGSDAIHITGGLPATATASGARIAAVLRALGAFLHIDTMSEVLPILTSGESHISRRDAISLLYQLGTGGGGPANPKASLDWAPRAARRLRVLNELIARGSDDNYELHAATRSREQLAALMPALDALVAAERAVVDAAPIAMVWGSLRHLLANHVRLGTDGKRILSTLDSLLGPAITAQLVHGEAALETITNAIETMRIPVGRFGEARLTIVALADSVGLSFRSVRVLGLAEGTMPSSVREDPVLSDVARARIHPHLRRSSERPLMQLQALHRIVIAAQHVVFSVPRVGTDGRYREPSGVLIEAGAALCRPPLDPSSPFPDRAALDDSVFGPARHALQVSRAALPIDERERLARAARERSRSSRWPAALDLTDAPGPMDGWFPDGVFPDLPGLSPERPISASALARLIECPHRFLFERVFGWRAPQELVQEGTIDALAYGSLFHDTAEELYARHGAAFSARVHPLDHYQQLATEIAERRFAELVDTYPLMGDVVRAAQRGRLLRDLHALLELDWSVPKQFHAVEQEFGPVELDFAGERAHVHGFIDRIDLAGGRTLIRDLKTGSAKRRDKPDFIPAYDVQLGLYGLVARVHAGAWGTTAAITGGYVYPSDSTGAERSFTDDFDELISATEQWIAMSMRLLRDRRFPRTPVDSDCQYCSFKPVCGRAAPVRAERLIANAPELATFATLKLGEPDEG